jgi:hypothetical protein
VRLDVVHSLMEDPRKPRAYILCARATYRSHPWSPVERMRSTHPRPFDACVSPLARARDHRRPSPYDVQTRPPRLSLSSPLHAVVALAPW